MNFKIFFFPVQFFYLLMHLKLPSVVSSAAYLFYGIWELKLTAYEFCTHKLCGILSISFTSICVFKDVCQKQI